MAVVVVSLRDLSARLRLLEAAPDPAPFPIPALAAGPAPFRPASIPLHQDSESAVPAWPDGVEHWLANDAVKLAGIMNTGGTVRWCPGGGLDMWRADGRYLGFGPHKLAALRAAGLLPEGLSTDKP